MNPAYVMSWLAPVAIERIDALVERQLDVDDIILLYQDLIESGEFPREWVALAQQMAANGLIHLETRALQ